MADPFSWFRSRWCALIKHSQPGNRRICPDYAWAFHYHRKFIDNKIGSLRGVDVFQKVLAFVKEYEEKCQKEEKLPEGERYNSAQQEPDGQVIIRVILIFKNFWNSNCACSQVVPTASLVSEHILFSL